MTDFWYSLQMFLSTSCGNPWPCPPASPSWWHILLRAAWACSGIMRPMAGLMWRREARDGGDQQVDTFWMSGMLDLFVMLGPGPKAVSTQDGLLTSPHCEESCVGRLPVRSLQGVQGPRVQNTVSEINKWACWMTYYSLKYPFAFKALHSLKYSGTHIKEDLRH